MLTVAVCTWNRAGLLRRALTSHAALRVPRALDWELVVVDNGSTDDTAAAVAEFADRLPVRLVVEPTPGLSHARNAAVHAARGTWLLWADDDALPHPDWLAGYADAIARWPEAAVFGGPILPHYDAPAPTWLRRALPVVGNALSLLDHGPDPVPLGGEVLPFGANYAVRAAEQRRYLYAPDLGRVRDNLAAGEETAVVRAVLAAGGVGWYVPWARVAHIIPAARMSVRYLRRYYLGNGASVRHPREPGMSMLLGYPRWVWRAAVEHELLYRITRPFAAPERWARHLRDASVARGMLRAHPASDGPNVTALGPAAGDGRAE